jgi:hypothetical protein
VLPQVLAALEEHGRHEDARLLREQVEKAFPGAKSAGAPGPLRARRAARLPTKCAACGGPLRSNEVTWSDAVTAECPFCGAGIKAV